MKPGDQYLFWQLSRWPDVQPGLRTWCLRLLSPSAGWCYWYRKRLHWSCSYWMLMQRRATGSRFNCADLLPKTGPPQKHICPCWLSGGRGGDCLHVFILPSLLPAALGVLFLSPDQGEPSQKWREWMWVSGWHPRGHRGQEEFWRILEERCPGGGSASGGLVWCGVANVKAAVWI